MKKNENSMFFKIKDKYIKLAKKVSGSPFEIILGTEEDNDFIYIIKLQIQQNDKKERHDYIYYDQLAKTNLRNIYLNYENQMKNYQLTLDLINLYNSRKSKSDKCKVKENVIKENAKTKETRNEN